LSALQVVLADAIAEKLTDRHLWRMQSACQNQERTKMQLLKKRVDTDNMPERGFYFCVQPIIGGGFGVYATRC
jgi:hypothetical protein